MIQCRNHLTANVECPLRARLSTVAMDRNRLLEALSSLRHSIFVDSEGRKVCKASKDLIDKVDRLL